MHRITENNISALTKYNIYIKSLEYSNSEYNTLSDIYNSKSTGTITIDVMCDEINPIDKLFDAILEVRLGMPISEFYDLYPELLIRK